MTSRSLDLLGLHAEQVGTAADFHEAYGSLVEPDQENDDFKALVEAASAYRLAGQWRLLVERDAGVGLLLHAASLFTRAGLTYGAYLSASLAPASCRDQLDPWKERLLRSAGQQRGESELLVELGLADHQPDDILGHVQQQTYLLLACALLAPPGSPQATELRSFASESPQGTASFPWGRWPCRCGRSGDWRWTCSLPRTEGPPDGTPTRSPNCPVPVRGLSTSPWPTP
ncbi:hypothetical protein ACIQVK_40475 [Streptomyces sp. NPDC090493]|uniref:hypothetical protein n=1 Tax=Streptomyces sp. NPDC090493 TaxID=3365964 RepID=UPI00382CEAA9